MLFSQKDYITTDELSEYIKHRHNLDIQFIYKPKHQQWIIRNKDYKSILTVANDEDAFVNFDDHDFCMCYSDRPQNILDRYQIWNQKAYLSQIHNEAYLYMSSLKIIVCFSDSVVNYLKAVNSLATDIILMPDGRIVNVVNILLKMVN